MTTRLEAITVADPDTAIQLDRAIENIIRTQGQDITDAGARLDAFINLIAQGQRQLPNAVAYSNQQHYSWTYIAHKLGITPAVARRRYASTCGRPTGTHH